MNSMNHFEIDEIASNSTQLFTSSTENDDLSTAGSRAIEQMNEQEQSENLQTKFPAVTDVAETTDQNGFEWITTPEGSSFYRVQESGGEWTAHQG